MNQQLRSRRLRPFFELRMATHGKAPQLSRASDQSSPRVCWGYCCYCCAGRLFGLRSCYTMKPSFGVRVTTPSRCRLRPIRVSARSHAPCGAPTPCLISPSRSHPRAIERPRARAIGDPHKAVIPSARRVLRWMPLGAAVQWSNSVRPLAGRDARSLIRAFGQTKTAPKGQQAKPGAIAGKRLGPKG